MPLSVLRGAPWPYSAPLDPGVLRSLARFAVRPAPLSFAPGRPGPALSEGGTAAPGAARRGKAGPRRLSAARGRSPGRGPGGALPHSPPLAGGGARHAPGRLGGAERAEAGAAGG